MMDYPALVWFRKDLRLLDHPALFTAVAGHERVMLLYILEDGRISGAQKWWLHHSLKALSKSLSQYGMSLVLDKGSAAQIIPALVQKHSICDVYYNRCYEPWELERDAQINEALLQRGVRVHDQPGNMLIEPWDIKRTEPFKVYTPFWKHISKTLLDRSWSASLLPVPSFSAKSIPYAIPSASQTLESWKLTQGVPDFTSYGTEAGEQEAHRRLHAFLDHKLLKYKQERDFPALDGVSGLSPHLHFGEIHVHRVFEEARKRYCAGTFSFDSDMCFLKELGWREFSYHTLYHYPDLSYNNIRKEFDQFSWEHAPQHLEKWQQGMTGYPIVDAGMRQLLETGFIHNRVRMIVASFLTKDLVIDWRRGADWFLDHLLDGDLAMNSMNWQWCAGTGIDASPYFRIFNPVLQSQKFDPQADYIRTWVPELKELSRTMIHTPWEYSIPLSYPAPIVNHAVQRADALKRYSAIKKA